jgi:maltose O-acetyltransferase
MKFILKLLLKISDRYRHLNYKRRLNNCLTNGLSLGKNVTIMPGAFIDPRYSFLISIGDNCSLSNGVIIVAHDAAPFKFSNGFTRLGKVEIKENCYIGTNVIILPGVTIGPNVLIAAGSVVNKNIPPNSCVAGVPARVYSKFDDFIQNHKEMIKMRPSFDYKEFNSPSKEFKDKIKKMVEEDQVYVKGFDGKFPWTNSE